MSTRFPVDNLPTNMSNFSRALERSVNIAEQAQETTEGVVSGVSQSVASNYGLGARLPTLPGNLSDSVVVSLADYSTAIAAGTPLQRTWTDVGSTLPIVTPPFLSRVTLSVAATIFIEAAPVVNANYYYNWLRIRATSGLPGVSGVLPTTHTNYAQVMFTFSSVPPSTSIQLQLQSWGYLVLTTNSVIDGNMTSNSRLRMSANMRSIALV